MTSSKFSVLISLALPACELLAQHPYSLKHFILASRGFYHLSFPPTSLTLSFTSSLLMLPHCSRAQFLDLFSFLPSLTSLVISFSLMAVNNNLMLTTPIFISSAWTSPLNFRLICLITYYLDYLIGTSNLMCPKFSS